MTEKIYCGTKNLRGSQIRGSAEYCADHNQIRYYGIEAIDPQIINSSSRSVNRTKEKLVNAQLKMGAIRTESQALIKEVKTLRFLLEKDTVSDAKKRSLQKKIDNLLRKRDQLVAHLQKQTAIIENLQKSIADMERSHR